MYMPNQGQVIYLGILVPYVISIMDHKYIQSTIFKIYPEYMGLSYPITVMVSLYQYNSSIQLVKKISCLVMITKVKISYMIASVFRLYTRVPVPYQALVHVIDITEWTLAVVQNILMIEMAI